MTAKKKIKIKSEANQSDSSGKKSADTDKTDDKTIVKNDTAQETRDKSVDPIKDLEEKLQASEETAKESYDRFLRVSAEFENYKKRSAREMDEFRKFANQSLIKELLPIVDNLELAIKSSNENENAAVGLVDGVNLTLREILKVFEKYDAKPIEALGRTFDPRYHEAVMREETDKHPENTVINELQKGYLMHERLIRPSMVVVAAPKKLDGGNKEDEKIKDED